MGDGLCHLEFSTVRRGGLDILHPLVVGERSTRFPMQIPIVDGWVGGDGNSARFAVGG